MRMRTGVLGLLLALVTLSGCNFVLGLEEGRVERHDSEGCLEPPCASCAGDTDCETGKVCRDGACEVMDSASPDAQVGDGATPTLDAGGDAASCEEAQLRCEAVASSLRQICEGGSWKSGPPCTDGQLCASDAEISGACKPPIEICLGREPNAAFCNGLERIVCGPDLVSATSELCNSNELCGASSGAKCAVCVEGNAACDGDKLLLCNTDRSGYEYSETCNPGECRANLARCTSLLCDADAYSCEDNFLKLCDATGTAYVESATQDCGADTCDDEDQQCDQCDEGAVLGCENATTQSLCSDDGQSTVTRPCADVNASTPVCVGLGVCAPCATGQTPRCNHAQPQVCTNNAWINSGGPCASAALCENGTCLNGDCTPGAWYCKADGKGHHQCNPNGTGYLPNSDACGWCNPNSPQACATCQPNTATQACWDGSSQRVCNGSGTGFVSRPCTQVSADTPYCDANGQCVECVSDECENSGSILDCVGGTYQSKACGMNQTCFDDSCRGECRYQAPGCVPNQRARRICELNGDWGDPIGCGGTLTANSWEVCRDGACTDSTFINEGHVSTAGWTLQNASLAANRWRVGTVRSTRSMVLFQLNAFLTGVPTEPPDNRTVRMAIWKDDSDLGGRQPGELVAYTSTKIAGNGLNFLDILDSPRPQLDANATYWVGINISAAGSSLLGRLGTGDVCTLAAPITDVPGTTLTSFPDVTATLGETDYGLYVRGKSPL